MIAPIDTSRLANWDQLDPTMRDLGKVGDQVYFIPWDWGFDSMIVNTDTVKAADIPTNWKDLWDPKYAGRIALEDYAGGTGALAAAACALPTADRAKADLRRQARDGDRAQENVKTLGRCRSSRAGRAVDRDGGRNDTY